MENFDINKFDPSENMIKEFADQFSWLTIIKDGFDIVKDAKNQLAKKRNLIAKVFKSDRDKATQYWRDNRTAELKLLGIMAPIENKLNEEILAEEMREELDKRKESLPIRYEELEKLKLEYDEEFILSMNRSQFMDFLNTEKARLYEEEQEKKRRSRN